MTTFIGMTWEQCEAFYKHEQHENAQLDAIADHYDKRRSRREQHIDKLRTDIARLRTELARLEAKGDHELKIWHAALDRHIARNRRICAMYDELKEAEASA